MSSLSSDILLSISLEKVSEVRIGFRSQVSTLLFRQNRIVAKF